MQVFGSDLIDWINFSVFVNAWNLSSHEIGLANGEGGLSRAWRCADSLVEKYVSDKVSSMETLITSPWVDLPILIQLVTESLAWHGLVIQSCIRSSFPSGKKKKKAGFADQSCLSLLRDSVVSLCNTLEKVRKWLKEQINRPEDENLETLLSSLQKKEQMEGPGQVFQIIGTFTSSINETDLGDRISQSLKSWSHVDVGRKIVAGKCTVLSEFLRICDSKSKLFQALKQQIAQA